MLHSVVVWVVVLFAARGASAQTQKQKCGLLKEYRECGPGLCATACDSLGEKVCCDVKCVPGCYCADPYILDHLGQCVHFQKCPGPGALMFPKTELSVLEGDGKVTILVTRVNGSHGQITVRWRVKDPTGSYSDLNGSLQFGEDIREGRIDILLKDNDVRNPDLELTVELFEVSGKAIIEGGRMKVVIQDDDMRPGYPEMASEGVSISESEGVAVVRVQRIGGSDGLLRVQWRAVGVTAQVGVDFVLPAQGELIFEEGETEKEIRVKIVDDEVRESREEFRVELFDPEVAPGVLNFRRKTDGKMYTIVNIDDDDMTPGYPEMLSTSIRITEAPGKIKVRVVRRAGTDGVITVRWRVIPDTALPLVDYILPDPSTTLLTFQENVTSQIISIQMVDDTIKEKDKRLFVELFDPKPGPGVIKFRQGDNSQMRTEVVIIDDDMTPGLLQLERARFDVSESTNSIRVWVVRVGGTDGVVRVRWRTISLEAGSDDERAESGEDYKQGAGELMFQDGETRKAFVVKILDDSKREQDERFEVEIYDASSVVKGFKGLGELRRSLIVIHDDDTRPGILQLESTSYEVREGDGKVTLTIVRTDGSDGQVRVHWRTIGRGAHFVPGLGELVFEDGETRKSVVIVVVDDSIRNVESTRTFEVRLFNPSAEVGIENFKGLGERVRAVVTVQDDDIRPGTLLLDEPVYHIVEGGFRLVKVAVRRVEGTDGRIFVRWKTSFVEGELVFEDGETIQTVDIRLPADAPRENFEVELFDFRPEAGELNFRGLQRAKALIQVNIMPGILQLDSTEQTISEGAGFVRIGVVRDRGQAGRLVVRWRAVPGTAEAGSDFDAVSGELVFEENVQLLFINIPILDDTIRETNEHFFVELMDATTEGPGVFNFQGLGVQRQTVITIEDNDRQVGTFSFHETHVTVSERMRTVSLHVVRRGGFEGQVLLRWQAMSGGAKEGIDFRAGGGGELLFVDGQQELSFPIEILDNERRNGERTFTVGLFIQKDAAELGPDSMVTVHIKDDLGITEPTRIFFLNTTVHVPRGSSVARFIIVRTGDLSKRVSVLFSTVEMGGTARAGVDFRKTMGRIDFVSGDSQLFVSVGLVNRAGSSSEATPLAVFFFVRISEPSEGEVVMGRDTATVVITDLNKLIQLPKQPIGGERVEFRGIEQKVSIERKEITSCPADQILKECAPRCQKTCSGQETTECKHLAASCVKGCFCNPGMLLDSMGNCVIPSQCSATTAGGSGSMGGFSGGFQTSVQMHQQTTGQGSREVEVRGGMPPPPPPPPPEKKDDDCPLGTTFKSCESKCQSVCPGMNQIQLDCKPGSNGACVQGCYCPKGLLLDNSLRRCVQLSQCPAGGQIGSGSSGGVPEMLVGRQLPVGGGQLPKLPVGGGQLPKLPVEGGQLRKLPVGGGQLPVGGGLLGGLLGG